MIFGFGSSRSTDPAPAGFFTFRELRRNLRGAVVVFAFATAAATAADRADVGRTRSENLAATCAACHGTDGRVPAGSPIPGLAARPAELIARQMRDYRSGARTGTIMPQLARGYSDEQIDRLATWFSRQPAGPAQ